MKKLHQLRLCTDRWIKEMRFSIDKSTVCLIPMTKGYKRKRVIPQDLNFWDKEFKEMFRDFYKHVESNFSGKGKLFHFSKNVMNKWKFELHSKYYSIIQSMRYPYPIYIVFNYIKWCNNSPFNFIKENATTDKLKQFLNDIKITYTSILQYYINNLNDTHFKQFLLNTYVPLLTKTEFYDIVEISVTCDIEFTDLIKKKAFFRSIRDHTEPFYKETRISDETLTFYPFNFNTQEMDHKLPKIIFYDKFADMQHIMKKKQLEVGEISYIFGYEQHNKDYEIQDVICLNEDLKLHTHFKEAQKWTQNVIRFELVFSKKALKYANRKMSNFDTNLYNLNIDLQKTIIAKLSDMFPNHSPEMLNTNYFHEAFLQECRNAKIFLSEVNNMTTDARKSKLKRLKKKGVLRGYGNNIAVNEPYKSGMGIIQFYHTIGSFMDEVQSSSP
jgi:hypothetical protein